MIDLDTTSETAFDQFAVAKLIWRKEGWCTLHLCASCRVDVQAVIRNIVNEALGLVVGTKHQ